MLGCCARAASGHAAAAPPSSVMNWRRPMTSMEIPSGTRSESLQQGEDVPEARAVLGADLNRPEPGDGLRGGLSGP